MARIVEVKYELALSDFLRFFSKVKEGPNGCWLWTGARVHAAQGYDYGHLCYNGRDMLAHRAAYDMFVGHILDGYVVDHLCGNTLCVNPDHLEAVTQSVNIRRALRPKRDVARGTHCKQGHPMSGLNLYVWTSPEGREYRKCKTCAAVSARRRYQERGLRPSDGEARPGPLTVDADPEVLSEFCLSGMPSLQLPSPADPGSIVLFSTYPPDDEPDTAQAARPADE